MTTYANLTAEGRACVDHALATLCDTVTRFMGYNVTAGQQTTAAAQDALAAVMTDTQTASVEPYDSAQAFDSAIAFDQVAP